MSVQDRLNDVLQPRALPHDLVTPRDLPAQRLCRLVGDPDLRQKAASVKLRQHGGIDLIRLDLRMRNQPDLLRIGDDDPADVRSNHCGYRSRVARGFDDDNVAVGQLLANFLQCLATHDDPTQPAKLAVFPGHRLSKRARWISSPMIRIPVPSVLDGLNGSSRATRHLLIRARSASGKVAGAACNELGLSAQGLSAACPHLCAPGAPCPRWAHHNPLPRESSEQGVPKSSCRITALSSAGSARFSTSISASRPPHLVRDPRGDADRPRSVPRRVQCQATASGPRHERPHPDHRLHRRHQKGGSNRYKPDPQSHLTLAQPAALSADYPLCTHWARRSS